MIVDSAGFAHRGDQRIASVSTQATLNYSMKSGQRRTIETCGSGRVCMTGRLRRFPNFLSAEVLLPLEGRWGESASKFFDAFREVSLLRRHRAHNGLEHFKTVRTP